MNIRPVIAAACAAAALACNNPEQPQDSGNTEQRNLKQAISSLEQELKRSGDIPDDSLANVLIGRYVDFSNRHHADTLAGEYMLRAASLAAGVGKYQQALDLLINYYDGYPNSSRRPEAAFTAGFVCDEYLRNTELAVRYYQAVIDNHPESPYAAQAEAALRLVGMTDEELLRFIESRNP
jgi:tetratricopeptide (TPR) repeat protein